MVRVVAGSPAGRVDWIHFGPQCYNKPGPPPAQGAQEQRQPCSSLSSVRSRLLPPRHAAIDPAPARRSCLMHAQCWPAPAPRRTVTRPTPWQASNRTATVHVPSRAGLPAVVANHKARSFPGYATRRAATLYLYSTPPLFRRTGVRFLASVPCRGPGRGDSCLRVHCHTVHCAGAASTCRSTRSTCNSSSLM